MRELENLGVISGGIPVHLMNANAIGEDGFIRPPGMLVQYVPGMNNRSWSMDGFHGLTSRADNVTDWLRYLIDNRTREFAEQQDLQRTKERLGVRGIPISEDRKELHDFMLQHKRDLLTVLNDLAAHG